MPKVNVKDKRKQQLIDANMVSIAKRGLTDTTITHVSEGASMSRGIVNFYFTSKEKMMQETLAHLIEEQTACWQDALAKAPSQEALGRMECVMRALMGDKLCSQRRLAVLNAFIGHAGTHPVYARLIAAGDNLFIRQMKSLWQEAGAEAKVAETRARQMLAVVRGHHTLTFLNAQTGKPSVYSQPWLEMFRHLASGAGDTSIRSMPKEPEVRVASSQPRSARKPAVNSTTQLDFGDLFAKL